MPQNRTFLEEFSGVPEETANKVAAICYEEVAEFSRHLARRYSLDAAAAAEAEAEKEIPALSPTLSTIVEHMEQIALEADKAAEIYSQIIAEKKSSP